MNHELVDIGINLTNKQFASDKDAVIKRAVAAGVTKMILTGTSEHGSQESSEMAKQYRGTLYSTAGVHPHDAKSYTPATTKALRELLKNEWVVSVGECGLDFNRNFSPKDKQISAFKAQIELAIELNKSLFLHERDAFDDFIQCLDEYKGNLPPTIVHCFTGTQDALKAYLERGFYIGITGWVCDERRGLNLQRIVRNIPYEKLMLETDAPFLTPRTMKPYPNRNEPAYLTYVLQTVAKCRNQSESQVAKFTTENAVRFFNL